MLGFVIAGIVDMRSVLLDHPIFSCSHGASGLKVQMSVLMCAWANSDASKRQVLLGLSGEVVRSIYHSWFAVTAEYVEATQAMMKLGTGKSRMDVEVDEVRLRKHAAFANGGVVLNENAGLCDEAPRGNEAGFCNKAAGFQQQMLKI